MLFRSGVAGGSEGFAKELVGVEIDLPVVVGVGVRTDGENGPEEVEVEDFDVGSGIGNNVGDGEQFLFQESDSGVGIDGAVELGGAINATERVRRVVLNGIAEYLVVTDESGDIVRRDDRGSEEAISWMVPVMPPACTKSPTLKGRRMTRNTPAAKLERRPAQAAPIAMPAAAMRAAKVVVSTPKYPRMATTRAMFSATPTLAISH